MVSNLLHDPCLAAEAYSIDSPALQAGVDIIVSLIEENREDAARSSREQFEKLQRLFYSYKHFSEAAHASEIAKLAAARHELEELRTHCEQCEQASQESNTQIQDLNTSLAALLSERDVLRTQLSSVSSAGMGSAPLSEGVSRSPYTEQPVPFFLDEQWLSFLEELGLKDIRGLTPAQLKESLICITMQLQNDRENARHCAAELVQLRAHVSTLESTFDFPLSDMYNVAHPQDDVAHTHRKVEYQDQHLLQGNATGYEIPAHENEFVNQG